MTILGGNVDMMVIKAAVASVALAAGGTALGLSLPEDERPPRNGVPGVELTR